MSNAKVLTGNIFYSILLIKLTPCRKVSKSRHKHFGFQDLILLLKSLKDVAVIIFIGVAFQIIAPEYLTEFLPFNSVLTERYVRYIYL